MRTRRSPRNQERLWRLLSAPTQVPTVQTAEVPRCWGCANYPRGGRARGICSLHGHMVNGRTENLTCFRTRDQLEAD